jgi:hypothetical protein
MIKSLATIVYKKSFNYFENRMISMVTQRILLPISKIATKVEKFAVVFQE